MYLLKSFLYENVILENKNEKGGAYEGNRW